MIKRVSGITQEPLEIKAIGETIVIDGDNYEVEELNSWKDEYDDLHRFEYSLKKIAKFVLTEEQKKELQEL